MPEVVGAKAIKKAKELLKLTDKESSPCDCCKEKRYTGWVLLFLCPDCYPETKKALDKLGKSIRKDKSGKKDKPKSGRKT